MKKFFSLIAVFTVILSLATAVKAADESFIGVSLFNPIQYPTTNASIKNIHLNIIYAENKDLHGIDFGVFAPFNIVRGELKGVQFGWYNQVDANVVGI